MKKIIVLLFFFITFIDLIGQEQFDKHLLLSGYFPGTNFINFIELADMDGDGDDDVVAAARDRVVGWYENEDGLGNFGNQILIDDRPREVISLDVADIDNDGHLDVLIASTDNRCVTWYRNMGNGIIAPEILTVECQQNNLMSALAMDVDGDGDQDVVFSSSNLFWCENLDGNGSFADPVMLYVGSQQNAPLHLSSLDLDGNGFVDLVAGGANSLYVYYNEGLGVFNREVLSITPSGTRPVHAFVDYDGDGDQDIVTGVNNVEWVENQVGSFLPAVQIYNGKTTFLGSGDIDLDGDMDVVSVHDVDRSALWLENIGPDQEAVVHPIMEDLIFPKRVEVNDIDKDGDLDMIISPQSGHLAQLYNLDGNGTFSRVDDVNAQLSWASDIRSSDLDGDGDLDVIISDNSGDRVDWYENVDGDGIHMEQHNIIYELLAASSVVDVDVDNDGDMDIIASGGNDIRLGWFENLDGKGNFSTMNLIDPQVGADHHLDVADINGDGYLDLVATVESGRRMSLYLNLEGTFQEEMEIFNISHEFTSTTLADLDGDGDVDIIAAQKALPRIFWSENLDGQGDFSFLREIVREDDVINNVHTADVDGDLDLDIVYTKEEDINWVENIDGIAGFGDIQEIDKFSFFQADIKNADVEDLDGDGDKDIIITSNDGLFWYENLGYASSRWSPIAQIDSISYLLCHVNDFSKDDINDIVAYSLTERKLYYFQNLWDAQSYVTGRVNLVENDSCDLKKGGLSDILVSSTNGTLEYSSFTNKNGQFLNKLPFGEYTTSVLNLPDTYTIDPIMANAVISEDNKVDSLLFCVDSDIIDTTDQTDLKITIFPVSEARPGFDVTYQIVFRNIGNTTVSDSIILKYPNDLIDFLSTTATPVGEEAGLLKWLFEDFQPFESRKFNVKFNIKAPPIVDLSSILRLNVKIYPLDVDINPENNVQDFHQYVVGSFDPNDITVLEGPEIKFEDYLRTDTLNYLTYVIRFQNTGTASAINVRIANILDPNLDWASLEIISASHDYRADIVHQDSLNFFFDGIYLPDSTSDLDGSQGYVTYRIQPQTDLAIGDKILNDAEIYFDFNEPILTNQVSTELIDEVSNVNSAPLSDVSIFPNPTNGIAAIKHNETILKFQVFDVHGRLIDQQQGSMIIDLHKQNEGLYFVRLLDAAGNWFLLKLMKI